MDTVNPLKIEILLQVVHCLSITEGPLLNVIWESNGCLLQGSRARSNHKVCAECRVF